MHALTTDHDTGVVHRDEVGLTPVRPVLQLTVEAGGRVLGVVHGHGDRVAEARIGDRGRGDRRRAGCHPRDASAGDRGDLRGVGRPGDPGVAGVLRGDRSRDGPPLPHGQPHGVGVQAHARDRHAGEREPDVVEVERGVVLHVEPDPAGLSGAGVGAFQRDRPVDGDADLPVLHRDADVRRLAGGQALRRRHDLLRNDLPGVVEDRPGRPGGGLAEADVAAALAVAVVDDESRVGGGRGRGRDVEVEHELREVPRQDAVGALEDAVHLVARPIHLDAAVRVGRPAVRPRLEVGEVQHAVALLDDHLDGRGLGGIGFRRRRHRGRTGAHAEHHALVVDGGDGGVGRGVGHRGVIGVPGQRHGAHAHLVARVDRERVAVERDVLERDGLRLLRLPDRAVDADLAEGDGLEARDLVEHRGVRLQRVVAVRGVHEAGVGVGHPVVLVVQEVLPVLRAVLVDAGHPSPVRVPHDVLRERAVVREVVVVLEEVRELGVLRQIRRADEVVVVGEHLLPGRHVVAVDDVALLVAHPLLVVVVGGVRVDDDVVACLDVVGRAALDRTVAHVHEHVLLDREIPREVVGVDALDARHADADVVEVVLPEHVTALLRGLAGVHVDRTEVVELLADVVHLVAFEQVVVAVHDDPGVGSVVDLVVPGDVADAVEHHAGVVGLVVVREVRDLGVLDPVAAGFERRLVAALEHHADAADVREPAVGDGVVAAAAVHRDAVVGVAPWRVDEHAAVGEVADVAVRDRHVRAAEDHRGRRAPVLHHEVVEVHVRGPVRAQHRLVEGRHRHSAATRRERGVGDEVQLPGVAVDVVLAGGVELLQQVLREVEVGEPALHDPGHLAVAEGDGLRLGVDALDLVVRPLPAVAEDAVQPHVLGLGPVLRTVVAVAERAAALLQVGVVTVRPGVDDVAHLHGRGGRVGVGPAREGHALAIDEQLHGRRGADVVGLPVAVTAELAVVGDAEVGEVDPDHAVAGSRVDDAVGHRRVVDRGELVARQLATAGEGGGLPRVRAVGDGGVGSARVLRADLERRRAGVRALPEVHREAVVRERGIRLQRADPVAGAFQRREGVVDRAGGRVVTSRREVEGVVVRGRSRRRDRRSEGGSEHRRQGQACQYTLHRVSELSLPARPMRAAPRERLLRP